MPHTLVLGLGNVLLCDEGVGVQAAQRLSAAFRDERDVHCLDGGTLSFALAGPIEDCERLIVLDAAELQAAPGSVRVFEGEAMDRFVGAGGKRSVHEVSLADLLSIACLAGRLPERRALIAIQPASIGWSDSPTPQCATAIERACALAQELIERWEPAHVA
jgi:hydrogenase maturation protease